MFELRHVIRNQMLVLAVTFLAFILESKGGEGLQSLISLSSLKKNYLRFPSTSYHVCKLKSHVGNLLPDILDDDGDLILSNYRNTSNPAISSHLVANENEITDKMLWETIRETQQQITRQQNQINRILELMKFQQKNQLRQQYPLSRFESSNSNENVFRLPSTHSSDVIPVYVFVDGTWLYYSIHERNENDCPIIGRYGRAWQTRYQIMWNQLPVLIEYALSKQHHLLPLLDGQEKRHQPRYQVYQTSIYTSYKNDTSKSSYRYQMYEDMKQMGGSTFSLNTMETVGRNEKCVDIQLAVDMLHVASTWKLMAASGAASIPEGGEAVAVLLSGDKDFKPAMIRTHQMGMKVALCSMKRGCNRALYTDTTEGTASKTSSILDYPSVIWLEEYLDQLIQLKPFVQVDSNGVNFAGSSAAITGQPPVGTGQSIPSKLGTLPTLSLYTITKVINDFIVASNCRRVNSRDMGRYLKKVVVPSLGSILQEIKVCHGGLRQFLTVSGNLYTVETSPFKQDGSDRAYWISFRNKEANEEILNSYFVSTTLTSAEHAFFEKFYSVGPLQSNYDVVYQRTVLEEWQRMEVKPPMQRSSRFFLDESNEDDDEEDNNTDTVESVIHESDEQNKISHKNLPFESCSVAQLKEMSRAMGLPVSGRKVQLIERLQLASNSNSKDTDKVLSSDKAQNQVITGERTKKNLKSNIIDVDPELSRYLQILMKEFLQASGGEASSRNVGRYLAAYKPLRLGQSQSALDELKIKYGSLATFLNVILQDDSSGLQIIRTFNQTRQSDNSEGEDYGRYVFFIGLVDRVSC